MPDVPIVPEDPFGKRRKGKERPGVSARDSMFMHQHADTDSSWDALHHTLGRKATQAATGNHGHSHNTEALGFAAARGGYTVPTSDWFSLTASPGAGLEWESPTGNFNTSTGVYTIPVAGIWHVYGTASFGGWSATAHKLIGVYNGALTVEYVRGSAEINSTGAQGATVSVPINLAVNDTIVFRIWQDNGAAQTMAASPSTFFGCYLVKAL